jgi:hypothetical protein
MVEVGWRVGRGGKSYSVPNPAMEQVESGRLAPRGRAYAWNKTVTYFKLSLRRLVYGIRFGLLARSVAGGGAVAGDARVPLFGEEFTGT